ncbi:uncharacterized protein BP5553_04838 [Venustampulla echinocandica]|uniref:Uncharacterized protein n=1 Tax=Venustampulla echinocandica TaxID=2656787 RepID=A0A370TPF5_9HELO|nr:uncharacterized protein BP5553_04838 [Venustampulla echinocandica]RDL37405.1 hypothetical protein BP5553_04838 [Venustampulla echinocandica]
MSKVFLLALVSAASSRHFHDLGLSVAGIIFLGAPLQGSNAAIWGTWLAQALRYDSTMLQLLQKDSQPLFDVARDFSDCHINWDSVCFYETQHARYGLLTIQTVNQQSATQLGKRMIPLDTDHSGLNKFSGENDENFKRVLPEIRRMVEGGGSIVTERYRINVTFTGSYPALLARIQTILRSDTTSSNKQRSFWGIFWVDVDKPSIAERNFTAVAKNIGSSVKTVPEALQVLAATNRSWLLTLDNADDPEFDYQDYFPPGNHGAVLMTSRVAECRQYSPDAFEVLEGLGEDDSKELLLKAAELAPESWPSHDDQANEVVSLLGSHTLALIQAGAYISQGHCQLHKYPEVYKRQRTRLLTYRPKQAQSRYCDVYATFEASADILEQYGSESTKDALRLLEILSMLGSSVLTLQVFEEAWKGCKDILRVSSIKARVIDQFSPDHVSQLPSFMVLEEDQWEPFRLTKAISLLASLSLVTRHDQDGDVGLSMHPLTYARARDRQDSERQGMAWIIAGCVLGFSRSNTRIWQTQERRLLPHILSYLNIKVNKAFGLASKAITTPIILQCSWALLVMRQDFKLSQLLEETFFELGQNPDEPSEDFLPLYELQARSLVNLGRGKEAVALLE